MTGCCGGLSLLGAVLGAVPACSRAASPSRPPPAARPLPRARRPPRRHASRDATSRRPAHRRRRRAGGDPHEGGRARTLLARRVRVAGVRVGRLAPGRGGRRRPEAFARPLAVGRRRQRSARPAEARERLRRAARSGTRTAPPGHERPPRRRRPRRGRARRGSPLRGGSTARPEDARWRCGTASRTSAPDVYGRRLDQKRSSPASSTRSHANTRRRVRASRRSSSPTATAPRSAR